METIISALIAAGSSLVVCIITQAMQARKTEALIEYRLLKLEEKVDKLYSRELLHRIEFVNFLLKGILEI
jgi:hypothetical protein